VQRRVEEANRRRESLQRLEDAEEVAALIREELGEGGLAGVDGVGEDHLAHGVDAVAFEEHVLGAGQADAGGAEGHRDAGLLRGVGIGADGHAGGLLTPLHELEEALVFLRLHGGLVAVHDAGDDFRRSGLELAAVNGAAGAIDAHVFAFLEDLAGSGDGELFIIDLHTGGTANANLAHLAGDERGVRGDATFGS